MNREPKQTFERFLYEVFSQAFWKDQKPTYDGVLARVREAFPHRKFTHADYLQNLHIYENKGGL